ncbi:MAG: galactokinase [Thermoflexales bacterium]|nr:galactokinase [Thermoflexales bacterium]
MDRIQRLTSAFSRRIGARPALVARAPGRVNLIGEHTDYNSGFVLPMAIDRDVCIAARARRDRTVRLLSLDFDQQDQFQLDAIQRVGQAVTWGDYVRGVAKVLQEAGYGLRGADMAISGNVPAASGLSSSAAIELATTSAFRALNELELDPVQAARLAQRAENTFVGVQCGIMDQFIASLGKANHALLIDCRSLEFRPVPLPVGVSVVIAHTGVRRGLSSSEYNTRRSQCEAGAWQLGVDTLRDVSIETFEARKGELPPDVAARCQHVVYENARVLQSVEALERGDLESFGQLMIESHASLRDLYEVSCAELDAMVEIACQVPGCIGARLTGAGFGGCAVAMARDEAVVDLVATIQRDYPARNGKTPEVYLCQAADGAGILS